MIEQAPPMIRYSADAAAVSVTAATFVGWLPSIAAVLSIIWMTIQIAVTVDKWLHHREKMRGPRGLPGPAAPTPKVEVKVTGAEAELKK